MKNTLENLSNADMVTVSYYHIIPKIDFIKLALSSDDIIIDLSYDLDSNKYFYAEEICRLDFDELYFEGHPVIRKYGNEPITPREITVEFCRWLHASLPEIYELISE